MKDHASWHKVFLHKHVIQIKNDFVLSEYIRMNSQDDFHTVVEQIF